MDVLNGISRISKEEFVEYAKGSFRMVYIIGMWFVGYTSILFVVTRYTVRNIVNTCRQATCCLT